MGRTSFEAVEIDAARQTTPVKSHRMTASPLTFTDKGPHLPAKDVEHFQYHIGISGQTIDNDRRRVEGIRVVLH